MKRVAFALVLMACTKHDEQATSSQPTSGVSQQVQPLPSVTSTATATVTASAVIEAGVPITSCTATFSCGLSHPGLGSSHRTYSVDLGKCERAYWAESGPYDPTSPRNPPKKTITKLDKADCDRLRDFAAALGPSDRTAAMESAHMDSEACGLTITCPGEDKARFDVQRQTLSGPTRVEQTIRAVMGGPP